ncbi:MAG: DUF3280 domain-containing protein [Burkholderiales bacterium]
MKPLRFLVLLALLVAFPAWPAQDQLKTIAVLDFGIIDDTGETAKEAAQQERLQMISDQLRRELEEKKLYDVLDNAPAKDLIAEYKSGTYLYQCNGCELVIARELGADKVLTAWVQKVSNLILNINIEIKDVKTGEVTLKKSADIRGNTDQSWSRGISYMTRDMVEKGQGGR